MSLQVGNWIRFIYVGTDMRFSPRRGQVVEIAPWGFRLLTADGYRSFHEDRMFDVVLDS